MYKRSREHNTDSIDIYGRKRRRNFRTIQNRDMFEPDTKNRHQQRIVMRKRKLEQRSEGSSENLCLDTNNDKHAYVSSSYGMVNFSAEYIQYIKESYPERSYLGKPKYKCKHCDAIFWFNERNKYETGHGNGEVIYSNCCKNGQIKIPKFRDPPTYLKGLLNPMGGKTSRHFLQKIRQYNSMFAFTSMGGNIDRKINQGDGPYVFRVNGQIHHRIGSLLPLPSTSLKFAELYIFDTKNEIEN
jgi:hypothetical protein